MSMEASTFSHVQRMIPGSGAGRPPRNGGQGNDFHRFARAGILASFAMVVLGAACALRVTSSAPLSRTPTSPVAAEASLSGTDDLLAAIGQRRELASLPILTSDPSLTTSSQQWADTLAAQGVGHDPAILDGISDDWQKVSELVSAGPSFATASRMLLAKAAGTSPLDDANVTSIGIGQRVEGGTTFVVVRLLRLPPVVAVDVKMGF